MDTLQCGVCVGQDMGRLSRAVFLSLVFLHAALRVPVTLLLCGGPFLAALPRFAPDLPQHLCLCGLALIVCFVDS